jgi:hypothetical protein
VAVRQNIGLFFLTAGSVLLSARVFWGKIVGSWKDLSWEQRFFFKLTGGRSAFESMQKNWENMEKFLLDKKFVRRLNRRERIITDLPLIALVLMMAGFFLCLNYRAF